MAGLIASMLTDSTMKAEIEKELGEEVVACGQLRQGKPPTMMAMVTGKALYDVFKPRSSKALPKAFLLAVTEDRVVALRGGAITEEETGEDLGAYIKGVAASWPRDQVSLSGMSHERNTVSGTLEIPGERVAVYNPGMDDERDGALLEALGGALLSA